LSLVACIISVTPGVRSRSGRCAPSAEIVGSEQREARGHPLEDREQQVIRMRYGLDDGQPRTLDQIGRRFGLSRERVRQIEREVMAKLRIGERADRLRAYAS
jgi:DNA-directed RNA polymerase sigma subunit (sigma70/sigma32)